MIRGDHINLRTVRESDFDHLFERWSDVANRGDHYPIILPSQIDFRRRFQEHGLWEETSGTLLIWDDEQIMGLIAFFGLSSIAARTMIWRCFRCCGTR
ncbi:MAG: hypothetical protein IPL78_06275 [Chloroflexi bacterium]|nr:hypothetical protein [Chloroflexota bacterium]